MNYHLGRGLTIRMVTVLVFFGIGAAAVIARSVQLQILESDRLTRLASRQHRDIIEIKSRRGDILDARGEALAVSREEAQVFARPGLIEDPADTAAKLAGFLDVDTRVLQRKLAGGESFVWVTRSATLEQARRIKELDLPGVGTLPASRRFYPGGSLAANVLGFSGVDGVGLEGLEYQYEGVLAGKPVKLLLERDARGNYFVITERRGPSAWDSPRKARQGEALEVESRGESIKLTILRPLQFFVERELERTIKKHKARAGCVVAMDPRTGAITAMASWPTFDPNRFERYSQKEYRNTCVQSAFEPGSTFKVFTAASALEFGVIQPSDRFFCENGSYLMGGETISDTKAYGWLSLEDVIVHSSNIGASKIGEKLGKERLYRAIKAFGFGSKTGIDFPGESAGVVRPVSQWSEVALGTISFGQGVAVTPLQLVTAMSAVANSGVMMKPYLVKNRIGRGGKEMDINAPTRTAKVISQETAYVLTDFMTRVVSPEGTGKKAMVPGYSVAGKTGTAQKPREDARGYAEGKYMASFVGFLPARSPRLVLAVVIDEPDPEKPWGGEVAAPLFSRIAAKAMVLMGVPSENEAMELAKSKWNLDLTEPADEKESVKRWREERKRREEKIAVEGRLVVPDLTGMTLRQALRVVKGLPLQVEVAGSGVVAGQDPAPYVELEGSGPLRLRLEAVR